MRSFALKSIASAILAATAISAQAAPHGTLTFLQPAGTIGANDSVDVWLRLTVDAGSDPFVLNSSLPNMGIATSDFPTGFASITNASTAIWFGCSDTFTGGCKTAPYTFTWNGNANNNGLNQLTSISLAPGQSRDFLFGTFTPTSGPVTPGTYSFYYAELSYSVQGMRYVQAIDVDGNPRYDESGAPVYVQARDANGNLMFDQAGAPIFEQTSSSDYIFGLAKTCGDWSGNGCTAFTRTVTAVPEPETYGMLLAGLGVMGAIARRRKVRQAA